jgi:hypothetical protein
MDKSNETDNFDSAFAEFIEADLKFVNICFHDHRLFEKILYGNLSREEIGNMYYDLFNSIVKKAFPEYEENKIILMDTMRIYHKSKAKKNLNTEIPKPPKTPAPSHAQASLKSPSHSEVLTYGTEIEISQEQAESYFQRNEDNGWIDTGGKPIRNWKKAMAGYFKKVKERDEDDGYYSTPKRELVQIPLDIKSAVEEIVNKKGVCEVEESNTNDGYYSTAKLESVSEPPTLDKLLEIVNKPCVCEQLEVEQQEATELTKTFFKKIIAKDWHNKDSLARTNLTNALYFFIRNNKASKT